MAKLPIKISDAQWLLLESRDRPMHVATLLIYSLPPDAPSDYLRNMVAGLRDANDFAEPFNLRLANPSLRGLVPMWEQDFDLDMEYHVRHLAVCRPGGERELGALISRVHSNPMDFNRPLWEYHVIEGLENDRFAIYFKMHHSLVDGIAGVRMLQRSMSTRPEETNTPALWSAHAPRDEDERRNERRAGVLENLRSLANGSTTIARGLGAMMQAARDPKDPAVLPFQAPPSILNRRIHSQRRFATQLYEFARIRRLAKLGNCTINDIVLALCSGALRRFLKELNALPGMPLTAGIPVSLRAKDDQGSGSSVAFIFATLATNVADPLRRLETIKASTRRSKSLIQDMPADTLEQFTMAMLTPYALQIATGLEGRTRPVFNVAVSNVPGPAEHLYFRGARLEAMYPVSAVTHGQALNITCYSYAGTLSFGFAACRDSLPRMQRLAVYTGEALEELERALDAESGAAAQPAMTPPAPPKRKTVRKSSSARKRKANA